jgi:hypothetical protein
MLLICDTKKCFKSLRLKSEIHYLVKFIYNKMATCPYVELTNWVISYGKKTITCHERPSRLQH